MLFRSILSTLILALFCTSCTLSRGVPTQNVPTISPEVNIGTSTVDSASVPWGSAQNDTTPPDSILSPGGGSTLSGALPTI